MKQIIEDLYKIPAGLLGEGYDNRLEYIKQLIDLEIFEFPSGTKFEQWEVPEEWVVRDGWIKYKGKKIIDYKKQPLSVVVGSLPVNKKVKLKELSEHLHYSDEQPDEYLYEYKFYEKDWGFSMPKNKLLKDGKPLLKKGEYEVFIDAEHKPGVMRVATHTIPGKTDKEVLLFAHLDHPWQANDNLSGVAALIDLVKQIKPKQFEHTIKLVFCPETIGSIAYAHSQDLSKVSFMIALDIVGNNNPEGILLQKAYNNEHRINNTAHLALRGLGLGYRQGVFRSSIGSDEYVFNDPKFGIPGLLFTTHPYPEYHTSADTPDKIDYDMIKRVQRAVIKTIRYYEEDFKPIRKFKGPLFRSGYGIQTRGKQLNLSWDYLIYGMEKDMLFSELCVNYGLNFEHTLEHVEKLIKDGQVDRSPIAGEGKQ